MVEAVEPYRCDGRVPLRQPQGGQAEADVAGHPETDRAVPDVLVRGEHLLTRRQFDPGVLGRHVGEHLVDPVTGDGDQRRLHEREQRRLVLVGADHQRHRDAAAGPERGDRGLREQDAVDDGREGQGPRVGGGDRRVHGLARGHDRLHRGGLERGGSPRVVGVDAQLAEEAARHLLGPRGAVHARRGGGLRDRAVEQPPRGRRREEGGDQPGARRLAEHRDPVGVAAEGRDVALHPAQREQHVLEGEVAVEAGVGQRAREVEEAEGTQTVVHRDHDDPARRHHRRGVVQGLARRSERIRAAVQPHHDRPAGLRGVGRRPHVQRQAVLVLHGLVAERNRGVQRLGADGAEGGGIHFPLGIRGGERVAPASIAGGRDGEADAAPGEHRTVEEAPEGSGGSGDGDGSVHGLDATRGDRDARRDVRSTRQNPTARSRPRRAPAGQARTEPVGARARPQSRPRDGRTGRGHPDAQTGAGGRRRQTYLDARSSHPRVLGGVEQPLGDDVDHVAGEGRVRAQRVGRLVGDIAVDRHRRRPRLQQGSERGRPLGRGIEHAPHGGRQRDEPGPESGHVGGRGIRMPQREMHRCALRVGMDEVGGAVQTRPDPACAQLVRATPVHDRTRQSSTFHPESVQAAAPQGEGEGEGRIGQRGYGRERQRDALRRRDGRERQTDQHGRRDEDHGACPRATKERRHAREQVGRRPADESADQSGEEIDRHDGAQRVGKDGEPVDRRGQADGRQAQRERRAGEPGDVDDAAGHRRPGCRGGTRRQVAGAVAEIGCQGADVGDRFEARRLQRVGDRRDRGPGLGGVRAHARGAVVPLGEHLGEQGVGLAGGPDDVDEDGGPHQRDRPHEEIGGGAQRTVARGEDGQPGGTRDGVEQEGRGESGGGEGEDDHRRARARAPEGPLRPGDPDPHDGAHRRRHHGDEGALRVRQPRGQRGQDRQRHRDDRDERPAGDETAARERAVPRAQQRPHATGPNSAR